MKTLTKKMQEAISPELALKLLIAGNERFTNNLKVNRNLLEQANETSESQHPFAVILSCIDSRTSVELIFDQGIGDVFSIRIAGTIINDDILGSMEFACEIAGAKIIVILGHTNCGAVKGACDKVEMGKLTCLLSKIQPAVSSEKTVTEDRSSNNEEFVEKVTAINVEKSVQAVIEQSDILRKRIEAGKCGIVGGNHDISTGKVTFYPHTMFGFKPSDNVPENQVMLRSKL